MAMKTARHLLARFGHDAHALNPRRFFSSAPHLIRRRGTCFEEASDEPQEQNTIYKRALRLQRPSTVRFQAALRNSVSLIGTIEIPLQQCRKFNSFCLFTVLRVYSSAGAYGGFRVLLKFRDEIARMSKENLKPSDLVYVSGNLGSYVGAAEDPKKIRDYEVIVKEVNFVAQQRHDEPSSPNPLISKPQGAALFTPSKEERDKKRRDRLHLWHVYFANPYEWLDLRGRKKNPKEPDFKHKDSGEALWIRESDPFWVTRQLQLLDLRSHKQGMNNGYMHRARPNLTQLAYDDT